MTGLGSSIHDYVRGDFWPQSCVLCLVLVGLVQLSLHKLGLFHRAWVLISSGFLPAALAVEFSVEKALSSTP